MKNMYYKWMVISLFVLPIIALGQGDSATTKTHVQFKLGAFYNSGLNYYGRTDSLRSSGFFPLAEIWLDEHFYLNAAPVFVHNSVRQLDYAGTVATAGYRFTSANHLSGNVYVVKPFYTASSQLVQSALKAQLAGTIAQMTSFLTITIGADLKFSDKADIGATLGLDHLFRFTLTPQSMIVVDPSATLNAGTQQFTKSYFKQTNFLFLPGTEQAFTQRVSRFNVLSYEISSPLIYARGKWQVLLIPSYVMPQHLVEVEGRPDLSERGKNLFYATMGMKIVL